MTAASALTLAEFAAALAAIGDLERHPFLAVAVSGGPDSLALAILADRWARERGGMACAVTVDHRLRPESAAETRIVQGWLAARAIRHEILVWDGDKPVSGIQAAARAARYRLLAAWCRAHGCLHLLTAHQREDQAETHLMRLRAGSGADGLAAMAAVRELDGCRLVRPLLGVPKARLVALLRDEGQQFLTDPSNSSGAFERSRLRSAEGAGSVLAEPERLLDRVRALGSQRAERERAGAALLARAVALHPAGFGMLDAEAIVAAPHPLIERLLGHIVAAVGGALYPPRRARLRRLRERLVGAPVRGGTLGGCRFVPWRRRILVLRELAAAAEPIRLAPGTGLLWDRRFAVAVPEAARGPLTLGYLGMAGVAELARQRAPAPAAILPRLLYQSLPGFWDQDGLSAVVHLGYARDPTAAPPRLSFRPVTPLTRAGFTVV